MVHPLPRVLAVLAVSFALLTASTAAFDTTLEPAAFLRNYGGFSAQDLARAEAGTAVARSLPADHDEVAVAGAVFMGVSRELFMERFRDIAVFKRNPAVLAIGRFSSPPSASDMRTFTLDDDDLSALRRCRPGDCEMRLDAAGMARVQATLKAGEDPQAATQALREHLASYAADYLTRGDVAAMEYHDRALPRRITTDLGPIIRRSPYLGHELSAIRGDVTSFPGVAKSTNDHMLYWSVEKIATTPVVSLTHVIMSTPEPGLTAIASRQIYASHFFHASLGLTLVSDATGGNGPGVTVIYVNRSRVDAFSGLLGPVKRGTVRSRGRSTTERLLSGLRARLEGAKK
jgi:hypothetical protein